MRLSFAADKQNRMLHALADTLVKRSARKALASGAMAEARGHLTAPTSDLDLMRGATTGTKMNDAGYALLRGNPTYLLDHM
jgi:hypothetical protein